MPIGEEDVNPSVESSPTGSVETTSVDSSVVENSAVDPKPESNTTGKPEQSVDSSAKPTVPDPVVEAMNRLARPEGGKPQSDAKKEADTAPIEDKSPKDSKPIEVVAKEDPDLDKKLLDDPYAGWLDEHQRNLLKPKTRERIDQLHKRWKDAEAHPNRVLGDDFNSLLEQNKLTEDVRWVQPDDLAGLVKAQAAVQRSMIAMEQGRRPAQSDLQTVQTLYESVDKIREQFGIQGKQSAAPATKSFEGQLPQEYQDLVDIYGLPEKRVRLLAAAEQASVAPKHTENIQPPAPIAAPAPEGVDMEAIYAQKIVGVLAKDGISSDRMVAHRISLEPVMHRIVAEEFPGAAQAQIPAIFNALSPQERTRIFLQAHNEGRVKASNPPPIKQPTLQPTRNTGMKTGSPSKAPPAANNSDPVASAIARLARE